MATFENLYKDFRQKKVDCDKEEQETLQAFEMETGARRNMITVAGDTESEAFNKCCKPGLVFSDCS